MTLIKDHHDPGKIPMPIDVVWASYLGEDVTEPGAPMPKIPEILPPDHQAYTEAVEAMRRCHEAQDTGAPAVEVERLRLIAEPLFQPVTDYQMKAFGIGGVTTH